MALNGPVNTWNISSDEANIQQSSTDFFNMLKPHLNIIENCGLYDDGHCFADFYTRLNKNSSANHNGNTDYYRVVLADGSAFSVRYSHPACDWSRGYNTYLNSVCGIAHIDINGHKKPNINGRDMFEFWITKYGIYPRGSAFESEESNSKLENNGGCMDTTTYGFGCAAWVIVKGNMDYLHKTVHWGEETNTSQEQEENPE